MANLSLLSVYCVLLLLAHALHFEANAELTGPLIRHLSSILKWTRSSTSGPVLDANVIKFEDGYLMETVLEGKYFGVLPHSVRVSPDGDLIGINSINNNIVRINTPLSQYSRARSIAGSSQGRVGHVDGKSSDARFNRPKGLTVDDSGNIYVADTANGAIRKIRDGGVTTIAGGKSSTPGYRDGPSEQALFSSDFDIVYVRPMCSLIVLDRGNAALRQILLNRDDCDYQDNLISFAEAMMVAGAILAGYLLSTLRCHLGTFLLTTMGRHEESPGKDVEVSNVEGNTGTAKVKGWDGEDEMEKGAEGSSPRRLIAGLGKQVAGFFPFSIRPEPVATPTTITILPVEDQCLNKAGAGEGLKDISTAVATVRHRGSGQRRAHHPELHRYTGEEEAHHTRSRDHKDSSWHRHRETGSRPRAGPDSKPTENAPPRQEPRLDRSPARAAVVAAAAKYRHLDSFHV